MIRKSLIYNLFFLVGVLGCGVDGTVINLITRDNSTRLPPVSDNIIHGFVALQQGKVHAYAGSKELSNISADITAVAGHPGVGEFYLHLPGDTEFNGLILSATNGNAQMLAIVAHIPKMTSVGLPDITYQLTQLMPAFPMMDKNSTAAVLMVLAKAMQSSTRISALSMDILSKAFADIKALSKSDKDVNAFFRLVSNIMDQSQGCPQVFNPAANSVNHLISKDFLDQCPQLINVNDFLDALKKAISKFHFKVCYSKKEIRVVFLLDMRNGIKDRNCQTVDHFKWAKNEKGKHVYFTGGVYLKGKEATPVCNATRKTGCITQDQVDQLNKELGNWIPNLVRMYDDGTHGDAVAGDNIYTITFTMPYIPLDESPDHKGVRIGYKYTYGFPGQGWTGSEEWPGNERILELKDLNGDGIVTRYDIFGDETSNKDKANLLTPANGGCGVNLWPDQARPNCQSDVYENQIDTDGDCRVDSWPSPGTASPITVPCNQKQ